jgi:putative hydrolase of the HAD superfamily
VNTRSESGDVRGVIFDWGGVVWDMRWDVCRRLEEEYALPRGAVFQTLYRSEAWRRAERGLEEPAVWLEDAHRGLEARAGRALPRLHARWREHQGLLADNVALIRSLRPRYRTAILSNADRTLRDRLERELGLAALFDAIVCSAEVGVAKPDPGVYRLAADRLGLPAAACLFVDDYEPNVRAAEATGMRGLVYRVDRGDDLRAMLAAAGVASREERQPC